MGVAKSRIQISVINKIKDLRTSRGESQQRIARLLGTTNGHIGSIESLKFSTKFTLKQIDILAHHFEITTESLFREPDEEPLTLELFTSRVIEYLD